MVDGGDYGLQPPTGEHVWDLTMSIEVEGLYFQMGSCAKTESGSQGMLKKPAEK